MLGPLGVGCAARTSCKPALPTGVVKSRALLQVSAVPTIRRVGISKPQSSAGTVRKPPVLELVTAATVRLCRWTLPRLMSSTP